MTSSLVTPDGTTLHLQRWPTPHPARGTVLIVHGLGEHIARYGHVAQRLNESGWNVVGHDHRGHGRSEGPRSVIPQDDSLLKDLSLVIDTVRAEHPGPLVLLGHSMGGLIASRFVAEALGAQPPAGWSSPVDALVLSSPALAADLGAVKKTLLNTLASATPDLSMNNGLQADWISRDPQVVAAYKADPLVHDRITPRLARFILNSGELVRERAAQWRVPTLLIFAGQDRCVAPSGSRGFAAAAPASVVTTQEFEPLYHEIFNEPEQEEVLKALTSWLGTLPLTST
ncbi:MAG: hypothetical protein RLZZ618_3537 [Pseudomonadota bacterium]|jgi:alpha-beta hydrolase superfamily lysophospholipase